MILDVLFTTAALSLIIALRYVAVAALTHALLWSGRGRGRRLSRRDPDPARMRGEAWASLVSSPIYALPAAVLVELWKRGGTAVYVDVQQWPLWWLPASFVIFVLAQDAYYYFLHRALHHPRLFAWTHAGHHRSKDPSAWASFAFDPAEAALTAWFLPALALFVPVHIGVIAALLTLMTAAAVLNHAGREVWPEAWLRSAPLKWLITAEHHDLHHKRFACNYGLYFRYWDRLFGTDRPPEEERQASSTAMATASPPPMHREATPLLPPRA